jgi:hypothetical protein
MKLPRSGGGKLGLEVMELADHERPPMIRIPEYLERRRLAAGPVNAGGGIAGGGAAHGAASGTGAVGDDAASELNPWVEA